MTRERDEREAMRKAWEAAQPKNLGLPCSPEVRGKLRWVS